MQIKVRTRIGKFTKSRNDIGGRKYIYEVIAIRDLFPDINAIVNSIFISFELQRRFYLSYRCMDDSLIIILLPIQGPEQLLKELSEKHGYRFITNQTPLKPSILHKFLSFLFE